MSTVFKWPCLRGTVCILLILIPFFLYIGTDGFLIPEVSDDSGLEVRRQGIHHEFKPYVVRLAKLLRKRAKVLHSFQCIFVKYKQLTFVRCSIPYVQLPLYIRLIHW